LTSTIICDICPRSCKLEEGQVGFCNVRKNVNGENVDALYGLFYPYPEEYNQFAPGSYTICFPGCGMRCWFCGTPFLSKDFNGDISKWPGGTYRKLAPQEVVDKVKASAGPRRAGFSCGLMGLFGGEPTLHPEYIAEVTRLCSQQGCASKIHTSGFVSEHIMKKIAASVNIVSINLKGSAARRLHEPMGADSDVILRSIEVAWGTPRVDGRTGAQEWQGASTGPTLIRNLLGPGLEANEEETRRLGMWLVEKTSPLIEVVVEPMFTPCNQYPDRRIHHDTLPPGDDQDQAARRLWTTGLTLHDCGLLNVWLCFTGWGEVHVPSRQVRYRAQPAPKS